MKRTSSIFALQQQKTSLASAVFDRRRNSNTFQYFSSLKSKMSLKNSVLSRGSSKIKQSIQTRKYNQSSKKGKKHQSMHAYKIENIDQKLKQIIFLSKNGQQNVRTRINSQDNKENSNTDFLVTTEKKRIVQSYWQQLVKQNKVSDRSLEKIRQLKNKNIQEKNFGTSKQKNCEKQVLQFPKVQRPSMNLTKESFFQRKHQKYQTTINTPKKIKRKKFIHNNTLQVEKLFQNQNALKYFLDDIPSKQQKLQIPINVVAKEKALKFYSLIKGGYDLDNIDIEGSHLSLRKFNEAKDQFLTLNEIYLKVKESIRPLEEVQNLKLSDPTFQGLVSINQLNGKIAPKRFAKIMKINNIVN